MHSVTSNAVYNATSNKNKQIYKNASTISQSGLTIDLSGLIDANKNYSITIVGLYNNTIYYKGFFTLNPLNNFLNIIREKNAYITISSSMAYKLDISYTYSTQSNYVITISEC